MKKAINPLKAIKRIVPKAVGAVRSTASKVGTRVITHPKFLPAYAAAYKIVPRLMEGADKKKVGKLRKIDMSRKDKNVKDVDKDQLAIGTKIEMEHTDDPKEAKKIAIDHNDEYPYYYTGLVALEDCMKQIKDGRADGIIVLAVKSDALYSITKLLHYLKAMGSQGHSLEVKADRESFGFDGDGSDKIAALHAFRYTKDGKSH